MEELPILILLLVCSGFFSGAEIALFSLGPEKIQALKNKALKSREKRRVS
jgi:CBS domain containing-hemolysin-like protein